MTTSGDLEAKEAEVASKEVAAVRRHDADGVCGRVRMLALMLALMLDTRWLLGGGVLFWLSASFGFHGSAGAASGGASGGLHSYGGNYRIGHLRFR